MGGASEAIESGRPTGSASRTACSRLAAYYTSAPASVPPSATDVGRPEPKRTTRDKEEKQ